MSDCLKKSVRVVVRTESREIRLAPIFWESTPKRALELPEVKALLLSSSDLSRVKVSRTDAVTGKVTEFLVNARRESAPGLDLWLRDGDVIEVPDKP
ncbi:MAG: hypothetical protein KIS67_11285 [Verrucomicrobiae bacterium]|nr:hypothetical protein [Verrucomicrobiae bacterium]